MLRVFRLKLSNGCHASERFRQQHILGWLKDWHLSYTSYALPSLDKGGLITTAFKLHVPQMISVSS